jgi:hypothetical protein
VFTRQDVLAAVQAAALAGRTGLHDQPLTLTGQFTRRGRFIIARTTTANFFIACEVTRNGKGYGIYLGTLARVTVRMPLALVTDFNAGRYTETESSD